MINNLQRCKNQICFSFQDKTANLFSPREGQILRISTCRLLEDALKLKKIDATDWFKRDKEMTVIFGTLFLKKIVINYRI